MAHSLLLFVSLSLFVTTTAQNSCELYGLDPSSCTDGFPSKSQIFDLDTPDRRQVVIPAINFSCNGTITRWIIGAKWKGNNNAYTELQIWRKNSEEEYMKVDGTTIDVDEENNSEIYEVATSLSFQSGDVLGYFQPNDGRSELEIYVEDSGRITTYHSSYGNNDLTPPAIGAIFTGTNTDDRYPLIAVRTDPQGCACGFMSAERVYDLLKESDREDYSNRQLIFPSIRFTCDGELVKWIMAGDWSNSRVQFPELQIWRSLTDDNMLFEKRNSSTISVPNEEDGLVYEFLVSPPLPVQSGDILGVRQPRSQDSRLQVRYNADGDSVYYATGRNVNNNEFNINGGGVITSTDIPLVTAVVIIPPPSSIMPATSSIILGGIGGTTSVYISTVISLTSSVMETPIIASSPSMDDTMTTTTETKPYISSSISSTDEDSTQQPLPTTSSVMPVDPVSRGNPGSGGLQPGAVVGVVLALIILILLVSLITILFLYLTRRRQKKQRLAKTPGVCNPNYGDMVPVNGAKYTKNIEESVEVYANPYDNCYDSPDIAQHYETPTSQQQEWGIYVPTTAQRSQYHEFDDIYSSMGFEQGMRSGHSDKEQEEDSFFTQSDIYWVPASDTAGLYEQLSRNHFRELQRDKIQIKEYLGSGQFGTVSKGVWLSPRGQIEVAIKLLQAGAPEDSHVKFLKEAAIMGQFTHRNVISLLGVVTLGEPVMIVMELMPDGDLRDNLIKMRPIPGELPPLSLPQQLLDYCHQVSAGMKYLSDKAFVHRDLAARNILVSGKTCKIADFGMARDLEESDYYISHGGQIPVKWTAPEALHYKKYSTASDVWSFGCLMYEIWSLGHKPFEGRTNVEVIRVIRTGSRLAPPPGCPLEIYRIMICCWHPEAAKRPKFSGLLQTLSRSEHDLLYITEDVTKGQSQAATLGAPLETSKDIYPDLQNTYSH